jgi:hypothetical protein
MWRVPNREANTDMAMATSRAKSSAALVMSGMAAGSLRGNIVWRASDTALSCSAI